MSRTNIALLTFLVAITGCGTDATGSGSGGATSATTSGSGGTSSGDGGRHATDASSTTGDGGASNGEGGASTGSGDGSGGGDPLPPTPEECFAIHDNDECFARGCNLFLFHPDIFVVEDDACSVTDDLGLCFLQNEDGGGSFTPEAYVGEFGDGAPTVIGLSQQMPIYGWTPCTAELAATVPACCCADLGWVSESCNGITAP